MTDAAEDPIIEGLEPLKDYELEEELARARRDGTLLPMKAAMILETVGMEDSLRAIMNPDLGQTQKEDVKKNLMTIAGLNKTSAAAAVATGPGFSITINLPTSAADRPVSDKAAPVRDAGAAPLVTASFKVKDE